jgi:hypothetical protein
MLQARHHGHAGPPLKSATQRCMVVWAPHQGPATPARRPLRAQGQPPRTARGAKTEWERRKTAQKRSMPAAEAAAEPQGRGGKGGEGRGGSARPSPCAPRAAPPPMTSGRRGRGRLPLAGALCLRRLPKRLVSHPAGYEGKGGVLKLGRNQDGASFASEVPARGGSPRERSGRPRPRGRRPPPAAALAALARPPAGSSREQAAPRRRPGPPVDAHHPEAAGVGLFEVFEGHVELADDGAAHAVIPALPDCQLRRLRKAGGRVGGRAGGWAGGWAGRCHGGADCFVTPEARAWLRPPLPAPNLGPNPPLAPLVSTAQGRGSSAPWRHPSPASRLLVIGELVHEALGHCGADGFVDAV